MSALDKALPADEREALRRRLVDAIPGWYVPWLHLAIPSLFGLAIVAACVVLVASLRPLELLAVPITYVVANIGEWRAHKHLLHRRNRFAPILYDRHTPEHHMIYLTDDMAIRSQKELRLVLIPAYGILLIFLSMLVPAAALWWLGLRNVALLFVATNMAYTLSYEWLHLSYHLPESHPIAKIGLVRRLRRHHAVHHDPTLMQRWNFNVTVPLWDWVQGTTVRDAADAAEKAAARAAGKEKQSTV